METEDNRLKVFIHSTFFNHEFVDSSSGKTFESIDPSTEKVMVNVWRAEKPDVDVAVNMAKRVFENGVMLGEPQIVHSTGRWVLCGYINLPQFVLMFELTWNYSLSHISG